MLAISKARTAQVQTPAGWVNTSIADVKSGDRFRLVKPDGTVVQGACGNTEFTAGRQAAKLRPASPTLREQVREKFTSLLSVRPAAFA